MALHLYSSYILLWTNNGRFYKVLKYLSHFLVYALIQHLFSIYTFVYIYIYICIYRTQMTLLGAMWGWHVEGMGIKPQIPRLEDPRSTPILCYAAGQWWQCQLVELAQSDLFLLLSNRLSTAFLLPSWLYLIFELNVRLIKVNHN